MLVRADTGICAKIEIKHIKQCTVYIAAVQNAAQWHQFESLFLAVV